MPSTIDIRLAKLKRREQSDRAQRMSHVADGTRKAPLSITDLDPIQRQRMRRGIDPLAAIRDASAKRDAVELRRSVREDIEREREIRRHKRFYKHNGYWLPGAFAAGVDTSKKVEARLRAEGNRRRNKAR